jgi:uncharacterized protein (TIGR02246 family)
METVERLAAIHEIRDLITRYAIHFDDKAWDAFALLWADDACFVANGVRFEGRERLLEFLTTCLPDGYSGKHMNAPSLVEVAPDGTSATAKTDVVWISQDFENRIVGRYDDVFERRDGRWLFSRRVESTVPYTPGPPPMSETAMSVSAATMRPDARSPVGPPASSREA